MEFAVFGFAIGWIVAELQERYEDRKVAKLTYQDIVHGLINVKEDSANRKIFYIDVGEMPRAKARRLLKLVSEELKNKG